MIAPLPRAAMAGASSPVRMNGALTLTASPNRVDVLVAGARGGPEREHAGVVDQDVDVPPPSSTARRASARTESPSVRSAATKSAFPPASRISATTASPRNASRPLTRTCVPRRASRTAAARPMPLVAPVTSAVCPARSISAGPVLLSLISFPFGTLTGLRDPQWQVKTGLSNPICDKFGA